jgi:hypothetical protein
LVDSENRLINEEGRYIDEQGEYVDKNGVKVDKEGEYVIDSQPFLDDEGNPIVVEENKPEEVKNETNSKETTTESEKPPEPAN